MHYECPSKRAPENVPDATPDPPQTGSQKDPASRPQTTPKRRPRRHKKDRKEKPTRGASRGVSKPAPGSPVAMQWQSSGKPVANRWQTQWPMFLHLTPAGGMSNSETSISITKSQLSKPPQRGIRSKRRFATGFAIGLPLVCHCIATALPLDSPRLAPRRFDLVARPRPLFPCPSKLYLPRWGSPGRACAVPVRAELASLAPAEAPPSRGV